MEVHTCLYKGKTGVVKKRLKAGCLTPVSTGALKFANSGRSFSHVCALIMGTKSYSKKFQTFAFDNNLALGGKSLQTFAPAKVVTKS